MTSSEQVAFPKLSTAELTVLKSLATAHEYHDGETIFRAGQADIDLCVVETGRIDILNPTDGNRLIVSHDPGQFSGDIDLLTGRPVIVTAVAHGKTRVWRVPGSHLRGLLNRVPSLGEKLIVAFTRRRELLSQSGVIGLRVVGQVVAAIRIPFASFSRRTLSPSPGTTRKLTPAGRFSNRSGR